MLLKYANIQIYKKIITNSIVTSFYIISKHKIFGMQYHQIIDIR